MAIIGTFTRDEDGNFRGTLSTLTINVKTTITATEARSEKSPDYRVMAGKNEIGAGWTKTSKGESEYVSLKLDDPSFPAPIFANLVEGQDGYNLIWSRPTAR